MIRIKKVSIFQTSKILSIICFALVAVFTVPIGLLGILSDLFDTYQSRFSGGLTFIAIPFIYAIITYLATALACVIYNYLASRIGGIELEIESFGTPD